MTRVSRLLLIDDDPLVQRIGKQVFSGPGYEYQSVGTATEGLAVLSRRRTDVVILDHLLPDREGLDVLDNIRDLDRHLPVLFITAAETSLTMIEAMKRGAFDFLAKPLDVELLQQGVDRAMEARQLMLTPVELRSGDQSPPAADILIGTCPAMCEVYKSIGRVAAQDLPVLIVGERGTGKELVARLIQQNGPRAGKPFHTVKCSDFNGMWVDSELFGHEPDSFPGAATSRSGRIAAADGGVLLLKEIGDLPLSTQSKLVRLLRDKAYEPLGSRELRSADVTILATSSDDLEQSVAEGRFQSDLLYALGSFTIRLPPLRERNGDLPLLVDHIVKRFAGIHRSFGSEVTRVSEEAMSLLGRYRWPGNVDELQSVLKRILIEGKGTVLATESLALVVGHGDKDTCHFAANNTSIDWATFLRGELELHSVSVYARATAQMEAQLLPLALAASGGSQVKTARCLGITRGSLRKKLRQLGLLSSPGDRDDDAADNSDGIE